MIPINFYFIPVIFVWTLATFFKKEYVKYLDTIELIYIKHIITSLFLILGFLYAILGKKKILDSAMKKYRKLPFHLYIIMLVSVLFSFISAHATVTLLKQYDVSYFLPIVRGGSSILILIIGYFVFNEAVTFWRVFGFTLIMIGLFIMNKDVSNFNNT